MQPNDRCRRQRQIFGVRLAPLTKWHRRVQRSSWPSSLYGICQTMHGYARQHPLFMHDRAPTAWHRSLRPERLTVTLPCPPPYLWAAARKTGVTWASRSDDAVSLASLLVAENPQRRSHAGGRRQAGPRPRVSDFGSGLGAAIVRQLRSDAVRHGEWTPGQCV